MHQPIGGHNDLVALIDDGALDKPAALLARLGPHVRAVVGGWEDLEAHVMILHRIAARCVEHRKNRRPECPHLVPPMEAMRAEVEAMPAPVDEAFICPISMEVMKH